MRKRKVSVFIQSNIDRIQALQKEGWTLSTIHEDIQKDFGNEFSFNTFSTSLQRARKRINSNEKVIASKLEILKTLDIKNNPNLIIQENIKKDTLNIIGKLKNHDPFSEE